MNCAVHADREAVGFCRNCGKAMCSDCTHPVKDVLYCEDCLAKILGHSAVPGMPSTQATATPPLSNVSNPSPALAFMLGLLPGLGAFYNEQYGKGIIHLSIFLILFIAGVNGAVSGGAEAALWICLAALWVYMPIDAHRTAKARLAGQSISDPLENWSRNRPVGPIILIGLGVLFLLDNFGLFDWYRVGQFWPLILIAVGILMLTGRLRRP